MGSMLSCTASALKYPSLIATVWNFKKANTFTVFITAIIAKEKIAGIVGCGALGRRRLKQIKAGCCFIMPSMKATPASTRLAPCFWIYIIRLKYFAALKNQFWSRKKIMKATVLKRVLYMYPERR